MVTVTLQFLTRLLMEKLSREIRYDPKVLPQMKTKICVLILAYSPPTHTLQPTMSPEKRDGSEGTR